MCFPEKIHVLMSTVFDAKRRNILQSEKGEKQEAEKRVKGWRQERRDVWTLLPSKLEC